MTARRLFSRDSGRNSARQRGIRLGCCLITALATSAALHASTACAQTDAGTALPDVPAPPRYTIEIIVFTYQDAASAGNEIFVPENEDGLFEDSELPSQDAAASQASRAVPVFDDRSPRPTAAVAEAERDTILREIPERSRIELERVEPEAFQMQDTYRKLSTLDAYHPVLHIAWTQTTPDKDMSPRLPLRSLGETPLGLDGSIMLYHSRFLHLDVDLTMDASRDALRDSATDRLVAGGELPGQAVTYGDSDTDSATEPVVRYHIDEDRIMHDGDIRYFDHPRFGMLARVTPVEEAQEDAAPPADVPDGAATAPGQ